jgi:signal transduction histidine kinase
VAISRTAASVALQKAGREERDYREALGIIEQQTTRLSRIVDDMFTLARADAGNYPVRMAPMYLDEVVADAGRAAQVLAAAKGITIEVAVPDPAALTGDEELIRRLVGNLLDNAVRHGPEGSVVRVTLDSTPAAYTVAVSDDGPGIPPEIRAHIFERFYRGDAGRPRAVRADEGAGLGLALARWIARTHGGDVRLAASSDAGTTFIAELPRR